MNEEKGKINLQIDDYHRSTRFAYDRLSTMEQNMAYKML